MGFAISPDDRRIAVSVIEYSDSFQAPVKLRMYVEDLVGGGNHVDLFSSTSVTEWPIGWHAGRLLIAVGPPIGWSGPNVYGATSYHLVDATSGNRVATLDCVDGLVVAAGTACYRFDRLPAQLGVQRWDGQKSWFAGLNLGQPPEKSRIDVTVFGGPTLSPDGSRIAAAVYNAQGSPDINTTPVVLFTNGGEAPTAITGVVMGWLDSTHIVVHQHDSDTTILDTASGATTKVASQGLLFGVLPGGLG
ncbi:MAG: hypothetical protein M3Z28_12820 [Candidatus Dormibacteraeota bacterium]|nr:hypothetical protein [Candidatus Dormibacteraeota bacterium]